MSHKRVPAPQRVCGGRGQEAAERGVREHGVCDKVCGGEVGGWGEEEDVGYVDEAGDGGGGEGG